MGDARLGKTVPSQRKSTEPGFSLPDLTRTSEAVGGESSPRQKRLLQLIHRSSITAAEVGVRSQGAEESQAGLGSAQPLRDAGRSESLRSSGRAPRWPWSRRAATSPVSWALPGVADRASETQVRRPSAAQWSSDTSGGCTQGRAAHTLLP